MEDELDDFINFNTNFIYSPRFYTELTSLACTTGDSVDEALSMSTEYLSNVGDVDDIFQESMMVCIELSSRIVTLTDPEISIPRHETPDLLRTRIRLKRTLTRMEAHWKNLIQKVQSRDDKVVFLELQNLVQTARHAAENLPPCWDKGLAIPDPSDNRATPDESAGEIDDIPTAEEWERTMSKGREAVMIMDPGERNIATPRGPTQINPALNSPNTKLDEDERAGLQRIMETFESVRSNIATAWNKAMIWKDDEVVFARLNTLLSVAKEAADRVIEAALRADKNAADTFNNVQADLDGLPPYNAKGQQETGLESVKR